MIQVHCFFYFFTQWPGKYLLFILNARLSIAGFSLDAKETIRGTYGRHWKSALQNNNRILLLWKTWSL